MKDQNKKREAAAVILALLLLLSSFAASSAFAGSNIPVTIDITVTYIVNGNDSSAGGDTFALTADDPDSPMPDGSEAGKKTITVRKEGTYSFGNMYYEKPGVHWYTVARDASEKKGVVKDESIYRAKVIALNDGHGYVLTYKKGSDEKHALTYTDKTAPETGDTSQLLICCAMASAAAAALAVFALTRKKNSKSVK